MAFSASSSSSSSSSSLEDGGGGNEMSFARKIAEMRRFSRLHNRPSVLSFCSLPDFY
jgi:hypothetical protein